MNEYWRDFWGSTWRRSNPYGTPGPRSLYTKGYHRGEDIANAGSTADVPALHAGEIIDSGRSGVIGHWLCVKPDAYPDKRDIYCHMYEPTSVESGRVEAGDILGRTAGWGENPGSGWSGPHLHFVVSNLSDGGYNTDREDFDPNPFIDAYLATSASLDAHPLPTQKTVQEDDMAGLIQHKDRGIALIAPGYFKAVTPEELPIAVSRYGWPKIYDDSQVGAREFDLDVSLAVNGAGGDQQVRSELERSRDAVLKAINGMRGSV